MKKDDSSRLDRTDEIRDRRVKRSTSLFMSSSVAIEDFIVESAEQNEVGDIGNQAPKRRHKSLPLSFIATNEESEEMPNIELTPSASVNLGANLVYNLDYEAEIANNAITNDSLEINFNSPGPRAPIRQASKGSLIEEFGVDDEIEESSSAWVSLYFDQEQKESANFLNDEVKNEASPSLSPRAKNSPIETFKFDSKMRE
jgi:hypothetical protein